MLGLINIEALAFVAYLVRDIFGGALRFYLDSVGLGSLWFGADVLGLSCIGLFVYRYILVADSNVAKFVAAYLPFSLAIAYIFLETLSGVFSALKMIAPLFVGFCFCQRKVADYKVTLGIVAGLFYLSVAGVILATYVTFPWVGYSFESFGGVVREASRLWWSQDNVRISGFANDNTIAAYFILMTFVLTSLRRSVVWCLFWGLVALYAIEITTSKTSLGTLALYLVTLLMVRALRPPTNLLVLNGLARASFACILIPPLLMVILSGTDLTDLSGTLFSIQDRINNSWQDPFVYMADLMPTGFISGCGLGCFNYPQLAFSLDKSQYFIPVDNFYIGTLLMVGPIFIPFVFLVIQSMRWTDDPYKLSIVFVMNVFTVTVLVYSPAGGLMLIGIGFSEVFAPFKSNDRASEPARVPPNAPPARRLPKRWEARST